MTKKSNIEIPGPTTPAPANNSAAKSPLVILPDMKAIMKKANEGLKHYEETVMKIESLKKRSEEILQMDPEDKETLPTVVAWAKEARELRGGLENERKIVVAPFNSTVASFNALYNGGIDDIKDAEDPIKILRKTLEDKEEERLENKRQEKLKSLNARIEVIRELGGKLRTSDGRWVIQEGAEPSDNDIELTQAEIQAYEEDNWQKLQKQAKEMAAATLERERLARQKKEEEEAELQRGKDKLANDLLAMENERFMSRKDNLFILGFAEDGDYTVMGKLKFKTDELKKMDSDAWVKFMSDVKTRITNQKKEEEFNNRVSRLFSLGFVNTGNTIYSYSKNGFSFSTNRIDIESAESIDVIIDNFNSQKLARETRTERGNKLTFLGFVWKDDIMMFILTSKMNNTFKVPASVIESDELLDKALSEANDWIYNEDSEYKKEMEKQKHRSDVLSNLGMSYNYTGKSYTYKSLVATQQDFMALKSAVDSYSDDDFATMVKEVSLYIEKNKAAKVAADDLKAANDEKERLENQSDKKNLAEFSEVVRTRAKAFNLKPAKQTAFDTLLASFLQSVAAL